MATQEIQRQRQEIINELGQDQIRKIKAYLVSYGTKNWGMPRKESEGLADFTVEDMLTEAAKLKMRGEKWRVFFQLNTNRI